MTTTRTDSEALSRIFSGSWMTQAVSVAAQLGIADLLVDGPRTASELAERTRTHGGALFRLLRALASAGIFAQDERGRFSLTPLAALLRTDAAPSMRSVAIMMGAEFRGAWGELLHSVRTGEQGFSRRFGLPFFDYMAGHPDRHGIYDDAMTGIHGAETEPMLAAYDFAFARTVVDVGGGAGLLLAALLERHSSIQGVLFDLPAVVERARGSLADSPVSDRCRFVGGDFFSSVPAGADAYVLRHILHDWEDGQAIAILRRCREAMGPDGRVLVIETVIPPGNGPCFGKWLDLMMLLVGGRERTEEDYRRLFLAAGLEAGRVVPTTAEVSVLEGLPAGARSARSRHM